MGQDTADSLNRHIQWTTEESHNVRLNAVRAIEGSANDVIAFGNTVTDAENYITEELRKTDSFLEFFNHAAADLENRLVDINNKRNSKSQYLSSLIDGLVDKQSNMTSETLTEIDSAIDEFEQENEIST
jgi:hypothetical protein